jgi:YesN/AraC family two-component response regulator
MLITDFNMPVMNGVELAHSLLKMHPTTRICIMSGRMIEKGMLLNDWHFLLKPFGLDELERCMN